MGFQFSLATVLRLREIAEEREERLLGQILQQIAQCRQMIADLQGQRTKLAAIRENKLKELISAADLQITDGEMRLVESRQASREEQLMKLEEMRLQQVKVYELAHQARELLSGMREEQLEAFRRERTRLEQNAMDDNFISRRKRH
jgi:flagellar export protein FliJ